MPHKNVNLWAKLLRIVGGALVSLFALYTPVAMIGAGPGTQSFQGHVGATQATIDTTYINGFGGDPAADYHFTVSGSAYHGSSTSNTTRLLDLKQGDTVNIQYSTLNPSISCICDDATPDLLMGPITINYWGAVYALPLLGYLVYMLSRRRSPRLT